MGSWKACLQKVHGQDKKGQGTVSYTNLFCCFSTEFVASGEDRPQLQQHLSAGAEGQQPIRLQLC
jgi:hypothetical protein